MTSEMWIYKGEISGNLSYFEPKTVKKGGLISPIPMNNPPLFRSRNLGRRPKNFVALICSETSENEVFRCFLDPPEGKILGIWGIMNKPPPCFSASETRGGFIHRNSTDSSVAEKNPTFFLREFTFALRT